ncbi:hypothetical protein UFOVP1615_6 [uncultured Caudovirales phage]|uniref:Uncharacterized protein n=1 Tax=uncultured Caudovirales phage TaxID=2100421 RepID=A0A6J5SVA5_9CAUD|nr:hypothetical protein UFOVP1615_6 [uncultured Caudovirales phage]
MLGRWLPYVVIAVLLLAMWHEGCETAKTSTRSDTVVTFDTITQVVATRPRLVHTFRTDTITQYDTAYIMQDYTTSKVYSDVVRNDTLAITITDTISRNAIQGRSVAYVLRLPTKTITNTITTTKHVSGLYIGLYGTQQTIGIGATWVAPRWLGSVGYGTNGVQLGVGMKIGR